MRTHFAGRSGLFRLKLPRLQPRGEVVYRHALLVRLTHWVNALAIFILVGSGLNIFNAHPRLYWGQKGDQYDPAWLSIGALAGRRGANHGVTQIGWLRFDTTGVLGWSQSHGHGWRGPGPPGSPSRASRIWPTLATGISCSLGSW